MTQEEIEGNKLILEFMEAKIEIMDMVKYPNGNHDWEIHLEPYILHERRYGTIEDLIIKICKYHSNWEWLMPVCKKFNYLSDNGAIKHSFEYEGLCDELDNEITREYDAKTTFPVLVECIKWYNQNK